MQISNGLCKFLSHYAKEVSDLRKHVSQRKATQHNTRSRTTSRSFMRFRPNNTKKVGLPPNSSTFSLSLRYIRFKNRIEKGTTYFWREKVGRKKEVVKEINSADE